MKNTKFDVKLSIILIFTLLSSYRVTAQIQLGNDIDGTEVNGILGWAVSTSSNGNRIAIGEPHGDAGGADRGVVRVYEWNDSKWLQLGGNINGEGNSDGSGFAISLSSDGVRLAIGSQYNNAGGINRGSVRVFQWNGSNWTQIGGNINGEANYDLLGGAVSLSPDGSKLAVSASGNDAGGYNSGHVRVYQWNNSTWSQIGNDVDGKGVFENMGASISLSADGNTFAVGASGLDPSGSNTLGAQVRIYQLKPISGWTQLGSDIERTLVTYSSAFDGRYISLSSDGTIIAIGDYRYNYPRGRVKVYKWNSSAWVQMGSDINGKADDDLSGFSLSLNPNGTMLAIGILGNTGSSLSTGRVRLYKWNGTTWTQIGNDINGEDNAENSGYSVSLSSDGTKVVIGAPYNNAGGANSGHVRVYDLNSVLPVESLNLTATPRNKTTQLNWQTASEKNASHFDVEQSYNGKTFDKIGEIKANGNSTTLKNYSFIDETPFNGLNYYRLRQVDKDGTATLSNIVSVTFNTHQKLKVFPNPTKDKLTIISESIENYSIIDVLGREILRGVISGNQTDVDVSSLPAGMYLVKTKTESVKFSKY